MKSNFMLSHLKIIIATVFLTLSAAQGAVKITFDILFWADWPENNLRYISAGKEKIVPLQNGLTGGLYNYEGPANLVFYREMKPDPATGLNLPIRLASVNFPKPSGHYILLVRSKGDLPGEYQIFPIPITSSTFPPESVLAINLSKEEIKIQVQSNSASLAPRASQFFVAKKGDFPVQVASSVKGDWQLTYSTVHSMYADQRVLLIIHDQLNNVPGVMSFPIQEPSSTEESYVDKDYKPDEMPEWMKTGVFRGEE